jgi:hypothetical protein
MTAINKRLLELTSDQFTELMETGLLYSLFPELKGQLFNVQQFENAKVDYQKQLEIEQAAHNLFFDIVELTGTDPADLHELFEEHRQDIILYLEAEQYNINFDNIFDNIRGE